MKEDFDSHQEFIFYYCFWYVLSLRSYRKNELSKCRFKSDKKKKKIIKRQRKIRAERSPKSNENFEEKHELKINNDYLQIFIDKK